MILAAQLYHQKIADKFICTGQRIATMNSSGVDPAETSRDILLKLGVPDSAIEVSDGQNTSEEMVALGQRFQDSNLRIGLLTSAWHLRRAMRLAEHNGLHPIPIPADFRSAANVEDLTTGQIVECMIPSSLALAVTCSSAKEYLGMLVGQVSMRNLIHHPDRPASATANSRIARSRHRIIAFSSGVRSSYPQMCSRPWMT